MKQKFFLLLFCSSFLFTMDSSSFNDSSLEDISINSNAEAIALMQKFAPYVALHPKDQSRPTDVNWFFEKVALKKRSDDELETILEAGEVDFEQLDSTSNNHFLDPNKDKTIYKGKPFEDGKCIAPCYVNFVKDEDGAKIQYLFFYPWQGPIRIFPILNYLLRKLQVGTHEGDWEHIDVYLTNKSGEYELEKVFYAQHGKDQGDMVEKEKLQLYKLTHPMAFAALNSHASYPKNIRCINSNADKTSNKGTRWKTWKNIVWINSFDDEEQEDWLSYQGRWGASEERKLCCRKIAGNSPRGPNTKSWLAN